MIEHMSSTEPALELSADMLGLNAEAPQILHKLIELIVSNGPSQIDGAVRAFQAGDVSAALGKLHSLKSSVGSFGRSRAFTQIKSFEAHLLADSPTWSPEQSKALLADFDAFLDGLRAYGVG
jgi:hypothetical protein